MAHTTILKANGDRVRFSKQKVITSLRRSGANETLASEIAEQVANQIDAHTTTDDIYAAAYQLLHAEDDIATAARYNLRRAIHELGPTGFPFEQFVGRLLAYRGLDVQIGKTMQGRCVTHEIDVLAIDEHKERYIECKFHQGQGYATDVKVPLYIHARFEDIANHYIDIQDTRITREPWIITNTRFSKDAIQYGECTKMKLIGWKYPHEYGLEHLVEDIGLYPITVLSYLSAREKKKLLDSGIVLCIELLEDVHCLAKVGVSPSRQKQVIAQAESICTK